MLSAGCPGMTGQPALSLRYVSVCLLDKLASLACAIVINNAAYVGSLPWFGNFPSAQVIVANANHLLVGIVYCCSLYAVGILVARCSDVCAFAGVACLAVPEVHALQ